MPERFRPYQATVARGVALLDEKGPKDWRDRVDVDRLVFTDKDCVLGQIYGEMCTGTESLGIDWASDDLELYGFDVDFEATNTTIALREEWLLHLESPRAAIQKAEGR